MNRYEKKYIINKQQYENLKLCLKGIMALDRGGEYWVRSLYFDTIFDDDLKDKTLGLKYHKKIRLRIYSTADKTAKLEIKEKSGSMSNKEVTLVEREVANRICLGNYTILKEFARNNHSLINAYNLLEYECRRPAIMIDYFREAFSFPVNNIRITFDKKVSCSKENRIFSNNVYAFGMGGGNTVIFEIKYQEYLPAFLKNILNSIGSTQISISKYCLSREFLY